MPVSRKDLKDAIEEGREYPYCNELLPWFKKIGHREHVKRANRRQKAKTLLLKALRCIKICRCPHYAAIVLRRLGVFRA